MKKTILLILGITVSAATKSQDISVMPVVGLNSSNLAVSGDFESVLGESSPIFRGSFGLEGALQLSEKITVNLGVHYSMRGSTFDDVNPDFDIFDDGGNNTGGGFGDGGFGNPGGGLGFPGGGFGFQPDIDLSVAFRMNYIHIPITAGYRFELNNQIFIEPQFGFYYSYGTGGEVDVEGSVSIPFFGNLPLDQTQSVNFENDFSRHDFGLLGGVTFEVYRFFLRYRYHFGLKNIAQSGSGIPGGEIGGTDLDQLFDNDFETSWRFSAIHLGYRIRF